MTISHPIKRTYRAALISCGHMGSTTALRELIHCVGTGVESVSNGRIARVALACCSAVHASARQDNRLINFPHANLNLDVPCGCVAIKCFPVSLGIVAPAVLQELNSTTVMRPVTGLRWTGSAV